MIIDAFLWQFPNFIVIFQQRLWFQWMNYNNFWHLLDIKFILCYAVNGMYAYSKQAKVY